MSKPNLIGKVLNSIHLEKDARWPNIRKEIWERNSLLEFSQNPDYKLEEIKTVDKNGNILTTAKLWKKIDQIDLKISVSITADVMKMDRGESKNDTNREVEKHNTNSPL